VARGQVGETGARERDRIRPVTIHRADRSSQEPVVAGANPLALQATLFVTGAAVMAIEILGGRVIGPHFGASLYVWTALISVTLLALAGGYWAGGALADRRPEARVLFGLVVLAGALVLGTPVLRASVISLSLGAGLRLGAVLAATILFAPAFVVLGAITPFATRLVTSGVEVVGRSAGRLYAISTVGSFVGAVGTGFFLIPNVAVSRCLLLVGGALVVTGLATGRLRRKHVAVAALAVSLSVGHALVRAWAPRPADLVEHRTSAYGDLRVVDFGARRLLLMDGIIMAEIERATGSSTAEYTYSMTSRVHLARPDAKRALVVGLGGGAMVRELEELKIGADVLDIDPNTLDLAERYFGWKREASDVFLEDPRLFFAGPSRRYDAVIMDFFLGERTPEHVLSRESFADIRDKVLEPEGVLMLNYVGLEGGKLTPGARAVLRTLGEVYPHVQVLPSWFLRSSAPGGIANVVLVASSGLLEPKLEHVRMATFPARERRDLVWGQPLATGEQDATAPVLIDEADPLDWLEDGFRARWRDHLALTVPPDVQQLLLID
jgi:spermidine synthase